MFHRLIHCLGFLIRGFRIVRFTDTEETRSKKCQKPIPLTTNQIKDQNFHLTWCIFSIVFISTLRALLLSSSVIIMCMHSVLVGGEQQAVFLLKAKQLGLTSGKYVFVPYDTLHYSVPYTNVSHFALKNNSSLKEAYDAVLTITMASEPLSFNEAFEAARKSGEITLPVQPEQVCAETGSPMTDTTVS